MTTKTPEEYLAEPYGWLLVRDPAGGFSAEVLEFPGCIAEGDSADETVGNLERAAKSWIASELEAHHTIPEAISGNEYSGRLVARLPRTLHRRLALKAQRDNTSINQQIVTAVACWVGADDTFRNLVRNVLQRSYPFGGAVTPVVWNVWGGTVSWQGAQSAAAGRAERAEHALFSKEQRPLSQPADPAQLLVAAEAGE